MSVFESVFIIIFVAYVPIIVASDPQMGEVCDSLISVTSWVDNIIGLCSIWEKNINP